MADYSIYPKAIDGYAQVPLAVDRYSPVNAESVNRIRSATINIESTLGIIPHINDGYDEEFADVAERLDDIELECGQYHLDRSYDGRGIRERDPTDRGSGREVTVDSGAVRLVNVIADSTNSLEIIRLDSEGDPNPYDEAGAKALHATGDILIMGMTESLLYANKQVLQRDIVVPADINAMLIEEVGVPPGMTLEIEDGANLLIL